MKNLNSIFLMIAMIALVGLGACGKKGSNNNKNNNGYYYPYNTNNNSAYNSGYFNNGYNIGTGYNYLNSMCGSGCVGQYYYPTYYQGIPCYQYQMQIPGYGWQPAYIPMYYDQGFGQSGFNISLGAWFGW